MGLIKRFKDDLRERVKDTRNAIEIALQTIQQETEHIKKLEIRLCETQDALQKMESVKE